MSYKVELVNKSLEFCTFNLWACAIPKNKISVFIFADNLTQLSFSDAEVLLNPDIRKIGDDVVNTVSGGVGLPLGVEPSQAEMIAFPSALHNFIKCQLSIKCAGHYMDDYGF